MKNQETYFGAESKPIFGCPKLTGTGMMVAFESFLVVERYLRIIAALLTFGVQTKVSFSGLRS